MSRGGGRGVRRRVAAAAVSLLSFPSSMIRAACGRLGRLYRRLRWPLRCRRKCRFTFRGPKPKHDAGAGGEESSIAPDGPAQNPIRIATFNVAMFSMAPAIPTTFPPSPSAGDQAEHDLRCKSAHDRPRSILKQPSFPKPKLRVSINLPDNEIERRSRRWGCPTDVERKDKAPAASSSYGSRAKLGESSSRSVLDVLREVGADIIGLQNVKAEEEKGMRPLSDLAAGLGMKFVFAESWAPEYGNAILSRFPIKQWRVQKICDDSDFRNVVKATIEIPRAGEVSFHCTHLDHLDESWRLKQINSILQANDGPHILAGGLNALDGTDYSAERWLDIVKYHEEIGKPVPKAEVMKFLKSKHYLDAKNFAGQCEAVVVLAKGQDVQGTCKYGTRVDYILASPNSPYKLVPGSYEVLSSKGTSDHHIVKVDIVIDNSIIEKDRRNPSGRRRCVDTGKNSFKGIF
ncbi:hypothetical protein AXF42_Ash016078 [Apostasia shenzhenica]|uniref:Endonuclease/exonuclease/phosphatase domain-containing protein n=1 Tax=Apostasia shenzhenica TaxID=1088818 RepID=A0A2I0B3C8_9ASPA|nr:hypothetical protein AXF42_Ash016078 [Apostasia shenzhenica]